MGLTDAAGPGACHPPTHMHAHPIRTPGAAPLLVAALLAVACDRGAPAPAADSAVPRPDTVAAPGAPPAPDSAAPLRGRWATPCLRVAEDVTVPARDTVCFRDARAVDFGAAEPFTIVVQARGPRADSMAVELRVERGDSVLYRDRWSTALYAAYDRPRVSPDSARRRAEHHLGRLLADDAVRPARAFLTGASDVDAMLRDAIAFDVRVDGERRRRRLPPGAELPVAARESPRAVADTARVRALAAELRDRPAFRYHAGGEASYAIAWSEREQRFVVVYGCC